MRAYVQNKHADHERNLCDNEQAAEGNSLGICALLRRFQLLQEKIQFKHI